MYDHLTNGGNFGLVMPMFGPYRNWYICHLQEQNVMATHMGNQYDSTQRYYMQNDILDPIYVISSQ